MNAWGTRLITWQRSVLWPETRPQSNFQDEKDARTSF
jgi:hypothetical protein